MDDATREQLRALLPDMPGMFYDRHGNPLDALGWADLHHKEEYIRVAWVELYGIEISTVWLGINHNHWREGAPIIFETMLFGWAPLDGWTARYETEADAVFGHNEIVGAFLDGQLALEIARIIPDGRKRHGYVKMIRDMRKHYAKTGVPGNRDWRA